MRTEDELKLIEFWLENLKNIMTIPKYLKDKITEEDAVQAFCRIDTKNKQQWVKYIRNVERI